MPDPDTAPSRTPDPLGSATDAAIERPEAAENLATGVRRQARRIEGLTGRNPLRGGTDD